MTRIVRRPYARDRYHQTLSPFKVGYFRKRHEDRKTKIPKRYSVHAALSLKGDWLEKAGIYHPFPVRWAWSMEKSSLS
jgi:hypothetical protein